MTDQSDHRSEHAEPAVAATDAAATTFLTPEQAARLAAEPVIPEIVAPWLAQAAQRLDAQLAADGLDLLPNLRADLVYAQAAAVARLTNLVLLQRYSSFHLVVNPLWRPVPAAPGDAPAGAPRGVLDAYIAWERGERLLAEDGPYPELVRLLHTAQAQWLANTRELLQRVAQARAAIADLAGCSIDALGPLTGARFGISDPHHGGRSAAILQFGARRVVYKPRNLAGELAFDALLARAVSAALGLPALALRLHSAGDYGFMQYVGGPACADGDAVTRAYRRYGALSAVAHALGTCDLHHENVIVHGEHPLVIDAEPLFRARLAVSAQGEQRLAFERNLSLQGLDVRESVLELGLLPLTLRSPLPTDDGDPREEILIGALCAYAAEPMRDLLPCARGSDAVQMRSVQVRATTFPNLPRSAQGPAWPQEHIGAIVDGFERTHAWLCAQRDDAAAQLAAMRASRVRLLARPTMDYTAILARSLSPERLRDRAGREAGIRADLAYTAAVRFDTVHALADSECASLLEGDVPRFELGAEQDACEAALLKSPLASAEDRWQMLDAQDCRLQVASIRERLQQRERAALARLPRGAGTDALLQHGLGVAELLVAAAATETDAPPWTFASYAPGFGATMVHADRESLYEGAAGTAVFVAEAARLADAPEWLLLARRVFAPLLLGGEPQCLRRSGGVGRGLGGLIYALLRVADCGGGEDLLALARTLALRHARDVATADGLDEVLYGRSGLLLALLALQARRSDAALDACIDAVAGQLCARAQREADGAFWPAPQGRCLPNVSHGTAGIAIALARWAQARDAEEGATLARLALRYDDTFWLGAESGWRDARLDPAASEQQTTWAWCNGRAGALLARQSVADALGDAFTGDLLPLAFAAPASDVLGEVSPGLCCGTPGAIDALLQVAPQADAALQARLHDAIALLARHTPLSQYSTLTPSLFAGSAGLGFALLRAARPDQVRSVLAFG